MKNIMCRTALFCAGFLLASCGGGGGGSSFSPDQPAALVAITPGNAVSTTSATLTAIEAGSLVTDFGLSLSFFVLAPLDATGGGAATRLGIIPRRARAHAVRAAATAASGPSANAVDPRECLVTGSVLITSIIATPGTLSRNDRVTTAFTDCDDGEGLILDGTLVLRVESFIGDLAAGFFVLTTSTSLDQLLVTADGASVLLDGDVALDIDTSDDSILTVVASGDTLDIEVNTVPSTLTDFSISANTDISNFDDWVDILTADGTLTSTALGGRVTFETDPTDPLVQHEIHEFPESGTIEILGAAGSGILVSDSTGDAVLLDVDSDGNGLYETTITTTWPALLP